MNKKSGISLVVIVITIAVMIILSSSVILNLSSGDGQISAAQRANIVNDISIFRDELNLQLSKNPRMNLDEFSISDEEELIQYIPSIENAVTPNGVKYIEIIMVEKGKLVLNDTKNLLEQDEKNAVLEVLE